MPAEPVRDEEKVMASPDKAQSSIPLTQKAMRLLQPAIESHDPLVRANACNDALAILRELESAKSPSSLTRGETATNMGTDPHVAPLLVASVAARSEIGDLPYWQAFLDWNRALPKPLVEIGSEYAVAQVAAKLLAPAATEKQISPTWYSPDTLLVSLDKHHEAFIKGTGRDPANYSSIYSEASTFIRDLLKATAPTPSASGRADVGPHGFDSTNCPKYYDGCNCESPESPPTIACTDPIRDALIDLVRLKDLKQWIESDIPDRWTGHKPEHWARVQQYEREKEPAWEAARLALENTPSATERKMSDG